MTSKGSKVLIGSFSICNRKKSITVGDNTIVAENLGDFFKNLGKKGLNATKEMAKKRNKIHEKLLKLERTLGLPLHIEAIKQLYHHYLK